MARKEAQRISFQKHNISFSKQNFYILLIGIALIFVGFYLMAIGDGGSFIAVTLAPIILFIAYVIVIPYAILKKFEGKKN